MLAIACIDGIVNNTILIKFIVSDFELNFKKFMCPEKRKRVKENFIGKIQ